MRFSRQVDEFDHFRPGQESAKLKITGFVWVQAQQGMRLRQGAMQKGVSLIFGQHQGTSYSA